MKDQPAKPLPTQFKGPYNSPGYLLWRVSNAWQREQRDALKPFGLTHTQFVALAVASWFSMQEELTQARLSQLTGSDPMTTSQVVRSLEKAGYFVRSINGADSRARTIEVSEQGRQIVKSAIPAVEAVDVRFFAKIKDDSDTLVNLFRQLI